jgi:hypothetical protein
MYNTAFSAVTLFVIALFTASGSSDAKASDCHNLEGKPGLYILLGGKPIMLRSTNNFTYADQARLLVVLPDNGSKKESARYVQMVTTSLAADKNKKLETILTSRNAVNSKFCRYKRAASEKRFNIVLLDRFRKKEFRGALKSRYPEVANFHFAWQPDMAVEQCNDTADFVPPLYEDNPSPPNDSVAVRITAADRAFGLSFAPKTTTKSPRLTEALAAKIVLVHGSEIGTNCYATSFPIARSDGPISTIIQFEDLAGFILFKSQGRRTIYWK